MFDLSKTNFSCHCFIEIIAREYYYQEINSNSDDTYGLKLRFAQKTISFFVIIIALIFSYIRIKKKSLQNLIKNSIFNYLESVIICMNQNDRRTMSDVISAHQNEPSNKEISFNKYYASEEISLKNNYLYSNEFDLEEEEKKIEGFEKNKLDLEKMSINITIDEEDCKENDNKYKYSISQTNKKTVNYVSFLKSQKIHYICDFNECCWSCCPQNVNKIMNKIKKIFYDKFFKKIEDYFFQNSQIICYLMMSIGPFLCNSIINVFSILISGCVQINTGAYFNIIYVFYSIIDLLCGGLYFFSCIFMVSFISTKREILKIQDDDKLLAGFLVHYHLKKALIFTFFIVIMQLILKVIFIFNDPFFQASFGNDSLLFCLLKNSFYFFFILSQYSNFKSINLIQDDDNVLKYHFKYFIIQSALIKSIPNVKSFFNSIKDIINKYPKNTNISTEIRIHLEDQLEIANENMKTELKIIESQKFNTILRNRGIDPWIPLILLWFIIFDSLISMILATIFLLYWNTSMIGNSLYQISLTLATILDIFEFSLYPILIVYNLNSNRYFHQDDF